MGIYIITFIQILFLSWIGYVNGGESLPIHNVGMEDFDDLLESSRFALIDFYAPWCSHCKALEPELKKVAAELSPHSSVIKLGKVDCEIEDNKELCMRYGIESYPSMLFFSPYTDKPVLYVETKVAPAIVKWIQSQLNPIWTRVKNPLVLQDLIRSKGKIVLGCFGGGRSKEDTTHRDDQPYKTFKSLAITYRNEYTFLIVENPSTGFMKSVFIRSTPAIVFYHNYRDDRTGKTRFFRSKLGVSLGSVDDEPELYSFSYVEEWMQSNSLPILGDIRPNNFKKYAQHQLPLIWFFMDYEALTTEKIEEMGHSSCKKIRSEAICCKVNGPVYTDIATHFGVKQFPTVVIQDINERKIYTMFESTENISYISNPGTIPMVKEPEYPGEISNHYVKAKLDYKINDKKVIPHLNESITFYKMASGNGWVHNFERDGLIEFLFNDMDLDVFFKKWIDGDLESTKLSQEAPVPNNGALTVITGNTFEDIVFDKTKNVLVKFYAPWCGYSQAMAKMYEEVSEIFKSVDNMVIGEIDVTSNESPFEVDHFPMIYLFPANTDDTDGILYDGPTTKVDITKFVKKNSEVFVGTYVITISGDLFNSIVFDPTKWVVVKFYDRLGEDSKSLAPIYEDIGKNFLLNDRVLIGEIDVKSNDIPIKVDSIPSIYIFPDNENAHNGIRYDGVLEVQELNDFIWAYVLGQKSVESRRHDEL